MILNCFKIIVEVFYKHYLQEMTEIDQHGFKLVFVVSVFDILQSSPDVQRVWNRLPLVDALSTFAVNVRLSR